VNQGNNLEHDFSCMHALLMFPMHVIGNSVSQVTFTKCFFRTDLTHSSVNQLWWVHWPHWKWSHLIPM